MKWTTITCEENMNTTQRRTIVKQCEEKQQHARGTTPMQVVTPTRWQHQHEQQCQHEEQPRE
jgi:hypothetical protein